jgi:hypothetical protein
MATSLTTLIDDMSRALSINSLHNASIEQLIEQAKEHAEQARQHRELAKTLWKVAGHYLVEVYRRIGNDLFEHARLSGINARDARRMMQQAGWSDPDAPARKPNVKLLFDRFHECWPIMTDAERDKFTKVFFEFGWSSLTPSTKQRYKFQTAR